MARVLYSYAKDVFDICGFCVDECCIKNGENTFCNLPLVTFEKVQDFFNPNEYKMISSVGFIEMNELREKRYREAKEKGYSFVSYIDRSVRINDDIEIEDNCIILDFVSIHTGSKIKRGTFISSNVNIGHDCLIEPYNWINSGVSIAGECKVGKGCFWGVNSSLGNGLSIGEKNFVAANTFVAKDTKDNEVYLSEPAQKFKLDSKKFLKFANIV